MHPSLGIMAGKYFVFDELAKDRRDELCVSTESERYILSSNKFWKSARFGYCHIWPLDNTVDDSWPENGTIRAWWQSQTHYSRKHTQLGIERLDLGRLTWKQFRLEGRIICRPPFRGYGGCHCSISFFGEGEQQFETAPKWEITFQGDYNMMRH